MNKNIMIKTVSAVLASVILCSSFTGCQKEEKTDNPILNAELGNTEYVQKEYSDIVEDAKKDETVYINTKSDGTVYKVNVTDWLHSDKPQVRIADVSNLSGIRNVNTLTEPVKKDGHLYWDMDTTDLYYSGVTKEKPPVTFSIRYFLDGKEMSAEKIAGKKGDVAIKITLSNSLEKKIKLSGKNYTITCPMLVAGGTILPEDTFTNIAVDYGKAIGDGAKEIVFFCGVPGIDKSLGLSELETSVIDKGMYTDTYTITAHTEHFELGNLMFAAIPLSAAGSLGNGGLTDSIDSVKDVLNDLETIEGAMNGLDIKQITELLYGDFNKIETIMSTVKEASALYSENEKMLKVLGGYITDENMKKLDKLVKDIEKTDIEAISNTLTDPKMKLLLSFLPKLSESLSGVSELAEDMNDVMPLFRSIAEDMDDPEIKKSMENLPATLKKLSGILDVLNENKELLETFGNLASENNIDKIEGVMDIAGKYFDSEALDEEQIKALAERTEAWLKFGADYDIFTEKNEKMKSTVMFAYKTDAIELPKKTASSGSDDENSDKDNKFVAWFKKAF